MPAGHQDHAGHPGSVGCDRGAPHLTPAAGAPLRLLIRADGAARGNPGPAAAGAVLIDASRPDATSPTAPPLAVIARPLGSQTNNFAEYTAVVLALEAARRLGAGEVELVLDSKLVVEQLSGRWKVRHPQLRPLVDRAHALLAGFRRWSLRHEPRASNVAADALANLALDDPQAAALAEGSMPDHLPARPEEDGMPREDEAGSALVGAACAIFDNKGRVLLVRHGYGRHEWELPGGGALAGEAPDAAARRELSEETGLRVAGGELSGVYYEPDADRRGPELHFVFRFPSAAEQDPIAAAPEIEELGFWALDGLPGPMSDFTERRIADAAGRTVAYRVVGPRKWRD